MRLCLALIAFLLSSMAPVAAQNFNGNAGDIARVSWINGWQQADGSYMSAIEIKIAPGWHTYWRAPGAAGIPPQFDWSKSSNLGAVAYEWPRPVAFETFGTLAIGYEDLLVLPVAIRPENPALPVDVNLDLFFGVCDDICVPSSVQMKARLTPGAEPQGRARIEASLATRALSASQGGVASATCALKPGAEGLDLTAEITFNSKPGRGQVAVVESSQPGVWISTPATSLRGRTVTARARLEDSGAMLDRSRLRLSVLDAGRIVDIRGCAPAG